MLIKQAGFIIAAVTVVFLWQSFSLSGLTIPLIGLASPRLSNHVTLQRKKRLMDHGLRDG